VSKDRVAWIDNIRFFAILCVVIGHTLGFLTKGNVPGGYLVECIIISFNIPLFFMLSGYTSGSHFLKDASIKQLLIRLFKISVRLLVPSLTFASFLLLLGWVTDVLVTYWFLTALWKVMALFIFICLIAIILKWDEKKTFLVLLFFYFSSLVLGSRNCEFSSYFILGILLKKYNILQRLNIVHCIILLLLYVILFQISKDHTFYKEGFRSLLESGCYVILLSRQLVACLACIVLAKLFFEIYNKKSLFSYLGTMTLGIYIIHDTIVDFTIRQHLGWCLPDWGYFTWLSIMAVVLVLILISVLFIMFFRKYKWTRLLLLGEF
jgi:fucose 4-O-acetylase-like acetyltransferase